MDVGADTGSVQAAAAMHAPRRTTRFMETPTGLMTAIAQREKCFILRARFQANICRREAQERAPQMFAKVSSVAPCTERALVEQRYIVASAISSGVTQSRARSAPMA